MGKTVTFPGKSAGSLTTRRSKLGSVATARALRFVFEVALLVALAVLLGLADVRPLAIVAVMALAWLIVVLVEWIAWTDVPHYGSGFPPRYYLPRTPLPPPRPIEQSAPPGGYPWQRQPEAATWIAPAGMTAEAIGAWPVAIAPAEVEVELAVAVTAEPSLAPEPQPEPEFAPLGAEDDPWHVQQLPAAPLVWSAETRLALHRLDPFAEGPRRRLRRRSPAEQPVVELPVLPQHVRPPRIDGAR